MIYENNFFDFNFAKTCGDKFTISKESSVKCNVDCFAVKYAADLLSNADGECAVTVELTLGIPAEIINKVEGYAENKEGYILEISKASVNIFSLTTRGLMYGVSTLRQLMESESVAPLIICDRPDKGTRGYRIFTPGEKSILDFKKMVDMLIYYKYNAVMIEIGGAMEYERHPKINETWVKFCEEVRRDPHQSDRIQYETHPQFKKNCIHSDNGNGGFITKAQMRELVEYCKEREIDVIPEVPSLSHCDYIVMAYPELREREEDTYPDTYCPTNPKIYEVMFDILDEVMEVFSPEYINIGHDECYSLAVCERCRDKSPIDLYTDDIIKISSYLKEHGVKTVMWGEKLYDIHLIDPEGRPWSTGGAGNEKEPLLYPCKYKIPTDILQLHWFWLRANYEQEEEIRGLGFKMLFGNFLAPELDEYRKRTENVDGAFVSNWGSLEEEYMQRNAQNFYLISGAHIFWSDTYDTDMKEEVLLRTKDELYRNYLKTIGDNIIEIVHTTKHVRPYKVFYDGNFIIPENEILGHHVVRYTDSTEAYLPVRYGYNIRCDFEVKRKFKPTEALPEAPLEVLGASIPVHKSGRIYYKTAYRNPCPEKEIESIVYKSKDGIEVEVLSDEEMI